MEGDWLEEYSAIVVSVAESGGMYAFTLSNGETVNYSATDEVVYE